MSKSYFITGTDTGVGKTLVACALLAQARNNGLRTAAIKPIASGCHSTADGLQNHDAEQLLYQCTLPLSYQQVNPIAFTKPVAPHIASAREGKYLDVGHLVGFVRKVLIQGADLTLVEGAGGWRVPINGRETMAELPKQLQLPVILVVSIKLGCINHALLTAEAVQRDGLHFAGWIANCINPHMDELKANIDTLQNRFSAPLLGVIPHLTATDILAQSMVTAEYLKFPED